MKKRVLALGLVLALCMGLVPAALAYSTPDFSDVPPTHWAYEAVMKMADAGVIKGTGNGQFSPEDKLTAEMFVVLVGRVVFPEVEAEGADWSGPYISAAQKANLLAGTQIDGSKLEAEISRYDMAVILRAAAKQMGLKETSAQASDVTDHGLIPTMYAEAVQAVYGTGLITGDQAGCFNGQNSMTRQEAATVMDRLIALPEKQAKEEEAAKIQAEKEAQEWYVNSRTGEYVTFTIYGSISAFDVGSVYLAGAPVGIYYKDGRLLGETTTDEDGIFRLELTVDRADFNTNDAVYYAALTDWYEFEGKHYNTPDISKRPINKLGEPTVRGYILSCRVYSYESNPGKFPNTNPAIFE